MVKVKLSNERQNFGSAAEFSSIKLTQKKWIFASKLEGCWIEHSYPQLNVKNVKNQKTKKKTPQGSPSYRETGEEEGNFFNFYPLNFSQISTL